MQRFAEGKPILARPPNALERVLLWARRRPALAALAAVSVASLIAMIALWSRAEVFARAARISAESNRTLLVRNWVMEAWNKADTGDVPGALPWFLAAWSSDLKSGAARDRLEIHSRRFAGLLENRPIITRMWRLDGAGNVLSVSGDSRWVAGSSADGLAKVWDLSAPQEEPVALTMKGAIVEAGFRPGSADLLLAAQQTSSLGQIEVWDLERRTRKFETTLDSRLRGLTFSADGRFFAMGSSAGAVSVLDAENGELLFREKTHFEAVRSLRFVPKEDYLATGGWDGRVVITDWRRKTTVAAMDVEGEYVRDLQVSKDGTRVVFGTDGGEAVVWQPFLEGKAVRHRHQSRVAAVALTRDGKRVASGDASGLVELWDADTGASLSSWLEPGQSVRSLEFSPDDRSLLTLDVSGQVRVSNVSSGRGSSGMARLGAASNKARWLSSNTAVTTSRDSFVRVWQLDEQGRGLETGVPSPYHDILAVSRDGQRIAAANAKLRLAVWRVQPDGQLNEAGPPLPFAAEHIEFSPDGLWLAAFGGSKQLSILDATTTAMAAGSADLPSAPLCGCWSPDSETLFLGGDAGRVSRVQWRTGKVSEFALPSTGPVLKILASPDGKRFATATGSVETDLTVPGVVRLWDAATAQPASPELVHSNSITSWAFSPDGQHLAAGDLAHTVRVWNLATPGAQAALLPHGDAIASLAFAGDGQSLVTGSFGHMLRVWDWRTGRLRSAFSPFPEGVRIEMDASGRLMLLHGRRYYARLWDVDSLEPISLAWSTGEPQERVALAANGRLTASIGENQRLRCFASPQARIRFDRAAALTLALSGALVDGQGHLIPAASSDIQAAWDRLRAEASQ
jgi:WD40 repeat protein